jgi:hypothetical protein
VRNEPPPESLNTTHAQRDIQRYPSTQGYSVALQGTQTIFRVSKYSAALQGTQGYSNYLQGIQVLSGAQGYSRVLEGTCQFCRRGSAARNRCCAYAMGGSAGTRSTHTEPLPSACRRGSAARNALAVSMEILQRLIALLRSMPAAQVRPQPSPGADVAGVSPALAQMRRG